MTAQDVSSNQDQSDDKPASGEPAWRSWLVSIGLDMALPIATYFVLKGAGLGEVPALILSGLWPLVGIAITVVRQRHVDEFAILVLIGIAVGVLIGMTSDSSRAVFLKDSITTGVIGLVFLGSLAVGKPLTFYIGRRFATDGSRVQRDWWDGLWRHPSFRSVQRHLAVVWGVGLVAEAAIRALLTWGLGTSAMVLANNTVPYAIIAALVGYSVLTGRRARAAAERQHGAAATAPTTAPVGADPAGTA